jgi:NAD(P)-dependent dehydrogenase (short-subunit alcohol dehydrogenase family)
MAPSNPQAPVERGNGSLETAGITRTETTLTGTLLLTNKTSVIFGATGAVGSAMAREFANQGARVFASGRKLAGLQQLAADTDGNGRSLQLAEVDALDETAVSAYLADVAGQAGSIDVVVNLTGPRAQDYANGSPTLDLPLDYFMLPLNTLVQSQFITARAAARIMVQQNSGVILFVTALPAKGVANTSAIGSAFGAMESLTRCLAVDLGPAGIRVACIRSGAMVDTPTIQRSAENVARQLAIPVDQVVERFAQGTLLKRSPTTSDTARVAAFLASDAARTITGAIVNASSGSVLE